MNRSSIPTFQPDQGEREVIEAGRDFQALVNSTVWRRLLDYLEYEMKRALTDLHNSQSTDPKTVLMLVTAWREREKIFSDLQRHVYLTIDHGKKIEGETNPTGIPAEFREMFEQMTQLHRSAF